MDPIGLILSIGTVLVLLDEANESFSDSHGLLGTIRTQMRILDAGVDRIKQWQSEHQAGAGAVPRVMASLEDAVSTVNYTMKRLQRDLEDLTAPNPKTAKVMGKAAANFLSKSKFAYNESQLRKHLTDVRECVSLVHFTLTVCQLPAGSDASKRAEELHLGAETLGRAQKSRRQRHRTAIVSHQARASVNPSPDFRKFLGDVLAEEGERERDTVDDDDEGYASDSGNESEPNTHLGVGIAPLNIRKKPSDLTASPSQDRDADGRADEPADGELTAKPFARHDTLMDPIPVERPPSVSTEEDSGYDLTNRSPVSPQASSHNTGSSLQADSPAPTQPPIGVIDGLLSVEAEQDDPEHPPDLPPRPSPRSTSSNLSRKPVGGSSSSRLALQTATPSEKGHSPRPSLPAASSSSSAPSGKRGFVQSPVVQSPSAHTPTSALLDDAPPAYEDPAVTLSPVRMRPRRSETDIDQVDEFGRPYIVKATQDNMGALVKVLIERGVNVEAKDQRTGRTAVMEAARLGRGEIAGLLLARGCRLDHVDAPGNTAVHLAVEGGNQAILRMFLESGLTTVNARGANNRTPLHTAAAVLDTEMAVLLLHNRADPTLKDDGQRTPLHISATRGHARLCEVLLDRGASVESYDNESKTPLQLAAQSDQAEVVEVLLRRRTASAKPNEPALLQGFFEAVRVGNVRMAQSFLEQGIKVKKIKESWKPAAYAAQGGNVEMLTLMLEHKASLKEKSPDGWTALHFAARHGHRGMAERLLEKKVSWKAQTRKKQETALHLAIAERHEAVAEMLLEHRSADVAVKDADDQAPLHHAARVGSVRLADLLLARGAKAADTNKYGWAAIHLATAYNHGGVAALLISRGASVEDRLDGTAFKPTKQTHEAVRRGYTAEARWPHPGSRPLHLALEFGRADMVARLLAHGAKPDERDGQGWRPLHHAAFTASADAVADLLRRGANPHATSSDGNTALALGFRPIALDPSDERRQAVRDLLRAAMAGRRKSRLQTLVGGLSLGASTVSARTQCWSAAEMAEGLVNGAARVEEGEVEWDDDEDKDDGAAPSPPAPLELPGASAQPPELDGQMHVEMDGGMKT